MGLLDGTAAEGGGAKRRGAEEEQGQGRGMMWRGQTWNRAKGEVSGESQDRSGRAAGAEGAIVGSTQRASELCKSCARGAP